MQFFYENKSSYVYAEFGTSVTFPAHLHHHMELVYLLEGRVHAVADTTECVLTPGDVFLAFPNQVHWYQSLAPERYFLCIFPPELCPEFRDMVHRHIPVSPCVPQAFSEKNPTSLFQTLIQATQTAQTAFRDAQIRGCLLLLLSDLLRRVSLQPVSSVGTDTLKALLEYCQERYQHGLSLDQIAHDLHISKCYISRLFSDKLHVSFCEYVNMLRISEACTLLKSCDFKITEIALRTGFGSLRSFNRNFLKYMSVSPKAYRRAYATAP